MPAQISASDCPKCEAENLVRQLVDSKNQIEVDQCWRCAGIWFDIRELDSLRNKFTTYEDMAAAVYDYVDSRIKETTRTIDAIAGEYLYKPGRDFDNRLGAFNSAFNELLGIR